VSKNPFDPFNGLGSIQNIHDQLGLARQSRWIDELQDTVSRWNRDQANLASTLGSQLWAQEEVRRLMAPQVDAIQAFGSQRLLQEAINQTRGFDPNNLQALAGSLSVREMLDTHHFLGEDLSKHWGRMFDTKAFTGYAAEQLSGTAALSAAAEQYAVPESVKFAEQLTRQVQALLPKNYADQLQGILGGIDFETIRSAAEAASSRMYDDLQADQGFDFDNVYDAAEQANLEGVRAAVEEALAAAFVAAAEKGLLTGGPSQWKLFFLSTLVVMLMTITQTIGQPIFQHWYEKAQEPSAATKKIAAKAVRTAVGPSAHVEARITFASPPPVSDTVLVSLKEVLLLRGPDTKQRIVSTVPSGQILRKRRTQRDWVLAEYTDPRGDGASVTGWVRAKHVRSVEAATRRIIMCAFDVARNEQDGDCVEP
jgi:hypothetical protein